MMKPIFHARFAFALLLLFGTDLRAGEKLTIATFNCEFLTTPKVHMKFGLPFDITNARPAEVERWAKPEYRAAKMQEATDTVAKLLKTFEADVLVLQEVGKRADTALLVERLKAIGTDYPHWAVCRSYDTQTRQCNAILSRHPLKDVITPLPGREGYFREPDDADTEDDTMVIKGMRATVEFAGHQILLYNLHLKSERGGHEADEQRVAQASIVRRHYLPELNNGKLIIVAGDLNDRRGQPALRRIRGFDDIWEDLQQTGSTRYFPWDKRHTRWTYEWQGFGQQIDHVLISRSFSPVTRSIRARTIDHQNEAASDHNPFLVEFEFR